MALRIAEHRRLTGAAGHGRAQLGTVVTTSSGRDEQEVKFRSFLAEFLVTTMVFCAGHGFFLGFVLGFVLEGPDPEAVRQGAIAITLCHAIAVTVDRFTIANWPFAKLKDQAQRLMGRVTLVHIALVGGTWFAATSDSKDAFFSVFVWLKAAERHRIDAAVDGHAPPAATPGLADEPVSAPERRDVRGVLAQDAADRGGESRTRRAGRAHQALISRFVCREGTPSTEQDVRPACYPRKQA